MRHDEGSGVGTSGDFTRVDETVHGGQGGYGSQCALLVQTTITGPTQYTRSRERHDPLDPRPGHCPVVPLEVSESSMPPKPNRLTGERSDRPCKVRHPWSIEQGLRDSPFVGSP